MKIQRQRRRSRHGRKLSVDDVEEILRRLEFETLRAIAKDYGVSHVLIHDIRTGDKWKILTRKKLVPFPGGYIEVNLTYDPRITTPLTLEQAKAVLQQIEQIENSGYPVLYEETPLDRKKER
jgi:hypothetical protein